MKMIKYKVDLVVLAFANVMAWFADIDIEKALKNTLLVVSIGYAVHQWIRFARSKKKD